MQDTSLDSWLDSQALMWIPCKYASLRQNRVHGTRLLKHTGTFAGAGGGREKRGGRGSRGRQGGEGEAANLSCHIQP